MRDEFPRNCWRLIFVRHLSFVHLSNQWGSIACEKLNATLFVKDTNQSTQRSRATRRTQDHRWRDWSELSQNVIYLFTKLKPMFRLMNRTEMIKIVQYLTFIYSVCLFQFKYNIFIVGRFNIAFGRYRLERLEWLLKIIQYIAFKIILENNINHCTNFQLNL